MVKETTDHMYVCGAVDSSNSHSNGKYEYLFRAIVHVHCILTESLLSPELFDDPEDLTLGKKIVASIKKKVAPVFLI